MSDEQPAEPAQEGARSERKIAIVGTSPTSWQDAPFADTSWEIWGLSRLWQDPRCTRWDAWFELHPIEDLCKTWANGNEAQEQAHRRVYLEWLAKQTQPIYVREETPAIPSGIRYPIEQITNVFPRPYFTNTVSYMIALAIAMRPTSIGVWGVDMAMKEEYREQRPSCEYWLGLAEGAGIEVYLPPQCNLLATARLYALEKPGPVEAAVRAKKREMNEKKKQFEAQANQSQQNLLALNGALQMLNFFEENYDV